MSHTSHFCKNKLTESGKGINGRSRERALEQPNFKEVPQFLKSKRISLAYGLTSDKDQSFMDKSPCFFIY